MARAFSTSNWTHARDPIASVSRSIWKTKRHQQSTRALLRLERTMNLLEGGKGGEGRMGERGWGGDGGRVGREGGEGTWGREGG